MKNISTKWRSLTPYFQSVLRILAAFTFMLHGMMKLFEFPQGKSPNGHPLDLLSQFALAGILETFGGALLIAGFCTRAIAFVLSGEMAVAYFQVHFTRNFWPVLSGGELAFLYCFIWLYFSSVGGGPWSIDALLDKRKNKIAHDGGASSQL